MESGFEYPHLDIQHLPSLQCVTSALLSISARPWSGLALMNDSGSAAVPSELRNLLWASWAFLGATPTGILSLEPTVWGRNGSCFLPACSVFPSGHMLRLNGQQSRKGEVLYSLLMEAQPCSGFQQLFEFGDPNLLLTAMSSLPCNLLNWF